MAKAKRKKKPLSRRRRAWLIVLVIAAFITGVISILHFTGIMPLEDMLWRMGFRDRPAKSADVQVHFVDVGQGDCTLVTSQGEVMLIDCGYADKDDKVMNYLDSLGITRIDRLVITHPHADHIGEMWQIIDRYEIGRIYMDQFPDYLTPATKSYERLLGAVVDKDMTITTVNKKRTFQVGLSTVTLIPSPLRENEKLNNFCTVVRIDHGRNSFLIAADAEKEEEAALVKKGVDLKAKVLRVGHHGGAAASSTLFLSAVLPRYAVISVGKDNDYGHPAKSVTDRLRKYASYIYTTAESGTVVFTSDGTGLSVDTERGNEE